MASLEVAVGISIVLFGGAVLYLTHVYSRARALAKVFMELDTELQKEIFDLYVKYNYGFITMEKLLQKEVQMRELYLKFYLDIREEHGTSNKGVGVR